MLIYLFGFRLLGLRIRNLLDKKKVVLDCFFSWNNFITDKPIKAKRNVKRIIRKA